MKYAVPIAAAGLLALLPATATTAETPVVGHTLKNLEVPGKISAVLWTRRENHFTLQIIRRTADGRIRVPTRPDESVQIWLLRANGTQILPSRHWETAEEKKKGCAGPSTRCLGFEIQYSYPLAAGNEAVAVALRFGDEYLIERLAPLPE
jgi:hypothetical protein